MGRLDGKTALVTGAARGSGAVIAERFAEEGAHVVVADIREEQGRAVAEKVGGRYVTLDVTSESSWAEAVGGLDALDIVVNNAGVLHLTAIEDTTVETYRHVFEVNELGTFLGIKSAIEPMKARGGGSIVNISSIDGIYVTPGTSAYAASKFAVRGLTKTAALELGPFNIRVNAVCPAAGNIEMVMEALPPGFDFGRAAGGGGRNAHSAPLGRRGTMRDVADAALYFASDEAAFVTGADLLVDGGMSAGMVIPGQPGT